MFKFQPSFAVFVLFVLFYFILFLLGGGGEGDSFFIPFFFSALVFSLFLLLALFLALQGSVSHTLIF